MENRDKFFGGLIIFAVLTIMGMGYIQTPKVLQPVVSTIFQMNVTPEGYNVSPIIEPSINISFGGEGEPVYNKWWFFPAIFIIFIIWLLKRPKETYVKPLQENQVEERVMNYAREKKGIPYGRTFGFNKVMPPYIWDGWFESSSTKTQTLGRCGYGDTFKVRYHTRTGVEQFERSSYDPKKEKYVPMKEREEWYQKYLNILKRKKEKEDEGKE